MAVVTINQSSIQGGDTAPDAPTGLVTEKEWDGVRLHWTNPGNKDIAYIEVWRSTSNDRSTATKIAEIKSNDYMDHALETGTRYYWIRAISTTGLTSAYYPSGATAGISGIPDQVDPSGAVDKDVLQYDSATNSWLTGAMRDGTLIKGALQATTDNTYSFPLPSLSTTTNNNGFDAASSYTTANGNGVQGQFTHYFGDTAAGTQTSAVFTFNTANGNSNTTGTLPWTGAAPTAATAVINGNTLGGLNFNGYATTGFANRIATSNQGGGLNAVHAMQFQAITTETFADGTLTITPTSVSRISATLSSVSVTGTRGQITFASSATPSVGQAVLVTGTNTGTSTGISAGVYYMIAATGTTACTLSATPGGDPITTTAGTTTGLTFARQFITVGYATQSYIPFGLNAKITISGITGVTNGTYMAQGTSTTTSVNIGVSTTSVSLGASPTLTCPTVTNMGAGFRIRAIPTAIPSNSGNRVELANHTAATATYRADTFNIAGGAYGNKAYKFIAEGPDVDYIRAAVIMPLDVPFSHLLNEPWVLSFRGPEWRMLIASTDDPVRWIDMARASGCIAYQRGHTKTFTYKWEMHPMDEFNCKIRPPNSSGITRVTKKKSTQVKNYDRNALVDDIRAGLMTQTEIGLKHGLSRIRVLGIAKEEGIRSRRPHHGMSKL